MLYDAWKLHNPSDSIPHFAYARKLDKKDILWVCWYAKKILKLTVESKKFELGLVQTCVGRLTSWKNFIFTPRCFCPDFNFQTPFFASIDHQRKSNGPKKGKPLYPVSIQGCRVVPGGAGGVMAHRNFGRSVIPSNVCYNKTETHLLLYTVANVSPFYCNRRYLKGVRFCLPNNIKGHKNEQNVMWVR